ncbi:hypothetical protein DL770_009823 [Monosporascus sp. CRB-9-2]|nr:hypothetical protein DL770_009823 [Monosporascus sp. CRB-9-2]
MMLFAISTALVQAERPLITTGYSGRDRRTPEFFVALADLIPGIRVHDTGGSDMYIPFSHIASESFRLSFKLHPRDRHDLLLDCDLQPSRPGSWINCGGTGNGWSNGAALGVKMTLADLEKGEGRQQSLVCHIVGDGSFMCAAPSSALWVASKYEIPILTIVLNNGGWKAPRNSTELVYPTGLSTSASDDEINVSFRPTPNYAALAEAAAGSDVGWGNTSANAEV